SENHTIRKITPTGVVSTLAGKAGQSGTADGSGGAARFNFPCGVAVDSAGNLFVADTYNHTIRKVTSNGEVTTLSGSPGVSGTDNNTGTRARFNTPRGVAVDGTGNLYAADTGNGLIRKITPAGVVSIFTGISFVGGYDDGNQLEMPAGV